MLRSRREAIGALVSTAAVMLLWIPRSARAALEAAPPMLPPELDLEAGSRFGTCVVTSIGRPELGAIPVRLNDSAGHSFSVDLLRHDPKAPGVARAGSLEVYVSNDGDGVLATVEEHGLAAIAIAQHLAAREAAGARFPALLTLGERSERRKKPRARI